MLIRQHSRQPFGQPSRWSWDQALWTNFIHWASSSKLNSTSSKKSWVKQTHLLQDSLESLMNHQGHLWPQEPFLIKHFAGLVFLGTQFKKYWLLETMHPNCFEAHNIKPIFHFFPLFQNIHRFLILTAGSSLIGQIYNGFNLISTK